MATKRSFHLSGSHLVDVYGVSDTGKEISFRIPIEALREPQWGTSARTTVPQLTADDLVRRRGSLLARFRKADVQELSSADFIEARTLGDPEIAQALESRYLEMEAAWARSDAEILAGASSAVLSLNPTHARAGAVLAGLFLDKQLSNYSRTLVAGHLSDAFDRSRQTEAMASLAAALLAILRAPRAHGWGVFVYACIGCLYEFDGPRVLRRCKRELLSRGEWYRRQLVVELSNIPAANVYKLLKSHLRRETSPRVRVQIVRILGALLSERTRILYLEAALDDESPSARYLALQGLRDVKRPTALRSARAALEREPDAHIRALLERVAGGAEA